VYLINTAISKESDVYIVSTTGVPIPKYGYVSGPNLLFLNAMNHCKRFNTVLLLETDCILSKDWLTKCNAYVENVGSFLISGSTYDGSVEFLLDPSKLESFFHINGVAFYNTGSTVLQHVIKELDTHLQYFAKNVYPINAYDYVMTHMIFEKLKSAAQYKFWRYVYRNMIKNTLIINCSIPMDKSLKEDIIYKQFPSCVILHKKYNDSVKAVEVQ
jgi:hypothetical protein